MKKLLLSIAAIFTLLMPAISRAQSGSDAANTERSLNIARNMIAALSGIEDDFKKNTGDFIMKDKSDNSYYSVKGIDLGTDASYVIVKPGGKTVIAAIYSNKDKDDKTAALAFAAFTGGIKTLRSDAEFKIVEDKEVSAAGGGLKYYLVIKDIKVASFSYDTKTNEGTLMVTIQ